MNLVESFLSALSSLRANKLRSVLTTLGVIIGVGSVIGLMSIGDGVSESITGEIQAIGTNLIAVIPDRDATGGASSLGLDDVATLSDPANSRTIRAVSASTQSAQVVISDLTTLQTTIQGVTPNFFEVNNTLETAAGSLLTRNDDAANAAVAVLGSSAATDLFGETFPVGQRIRMAGTSYEVVGVLEPREGGLQGDQNGIIYIPLSTAQSRLTPERTPRGTAGVAQITVQAQSETSVDEAMDQITELLRDQHRLTEDEDDDFVVFSQEQLLSIFDTITSTLTIFLSAIAGIPLLVGGIGIMNIMLVSVTERTREIGIRKAVGAKRRDILGQFLLESLLLSLIGGAVGILVGWLITFGAARQLDFSPALNFTTIALATGFSALVGIVFGLYPAWRASGLDPIDALRYE